MRHRTLQTVSVAVTAVALAAAAWALPAARETLAARQAATPVTGLPVAGATLAGRDGAIVGTATFTEGDDGRVTVTVAVLRGLTPGDHGIHVHETGSCDPTGDEPFASAGAHFNPTGAQHLDHAGDLGNINAKANGSAELQSTTDRFTLSPGPTSLADADGSALLIHEGADDLLTDPSGNSGGRIACGVVEFGQGTTVADATPEVPAAASPAAPGGVPTAEATPGASPEAGAATPVATAPEAVTVASFDIYFEPTALSIPAATEITVALPNNGVAVHSFVIDVLGISVQMPPGQTDLATTINAPPGTYEYYCDVPGHRAAGMVGTLTVQ